MLYPKRFIIQTLMMKKFIFLFAFVFCSCTKKTDDFVVSPVIPEKLTVGSVSNLGIFDPALTFDSTTNILWMSYSGVNTSAQVEPTQRVVSTRLASSTDGGATWSDQAVVLAGIDNVSLSFPGLPAQGAWQNEVSKILYDPNSVNANDRWKLLTHHYLEVKTTDSSADRRFEHGWISYRKASTPLLLASATEVKLFSAGLYDSANNSLGGTTGSPLGGAPVYTLQTLHPELNNCLIFTEPGLLSTATKLYLSLICVEAANFRVALFSCNQPCAVTSGWSYVKTLLQNSEAAALGYLNFSASELFTFQNENYLMVSPEGVTGVPGIYHGCYVYKFTDIATGTLTSTTPSKKIEGTMNSFNGACTFHASARNGFYYSEFNAQSSDVFRIFKSNLAF